MGRFEEMQVFVRTAQSESFTQAAQKLGLSKSIISQRVADLEERLGVRLLNRTTRSLSLTDAGQAFLRHAMRVLQAVDEAEDAASRHGHEVRGTLRIAAPLTFGLMHLRLAILDFMKTHVNLDVHLDMTDRMVDLVHDGYDLAVRIGRLPDSSLIAETLAPIHLIVAASPDYLRDRGIPDRPEALSGHDCLLYTPSQGRGNQWHFIIEGRPLIVPVRGRLQSGSGDMLSAAATAGLGIVQLPSFIIGDAIRDGRLVHILRDYVVPEAGLYAAYPRTHHVPGRVRLFCDFLAERFGKNPYWDRDLGLGHGR